MILDGHIHIYARGRNRGANRASDFVGHLEEAGIDGGIVLSVAPPSFGSFDEPLPAGERLDDVLAVCEAGEHLYPFFWVDPMETDALEQVDEAVKRGVAGFKIICNRFDPGTPKAMDVYRRIASHAKPILFHSGIFWDDQPSSQHCRPVLFEVLLKMAGLRFAMAHISWPWCDELIAVLGKFWAYRRQDPGGIAELFVDTTPGTPAVYRREALAKLFGVGYSAEESTVFGTDQSVNDYDGKGARGLVESDRQIYKELGLDEAAQERIFSGNLLRFLGVEAASAS
jgi:predicted TIM-barrel fold metal-dependent hydrolase